MGRFTLCHGYWNRPFYNTPPSGDGAAFAGDPPEQWLLVMDAMGHGPSAHHITQQVLTSFMALVGARDTTAWTTSALLDALDRGLRAMGDGAQAAMGLFRFDLNTGILEAVMVGNLAAMLLNPDSRIQFHSRHGMVGGIYPRSLHPQHFKLNPNQVLAVFSDGIRLRDGLQELPGFLFGPGASTPPDEQARRIVERCGRDYDDASCALVFINRQNHD
mgnify:CR=1 FL=1